MTRLPLGFCLLLLMLPGAGCATRRMVYEIRVPAAFPLEANARVAIDTDRRITSSFLGRGGIRDDEDTRVYTGSHLIFPREGKRILSVTTADSETAFLFRPEIPFRTRESIWSDWQGPFRVIDGDARRPGIGIQEIQQLPAKPAPHEIEFRFRLEAIGRR